MILDISGQSSPVLWADSSVDITKTVVEAYNAQSGVAAPIKAPAAACQADCHSSGHCPKK